eukprot:GFYU01001314.1.p1 GENE.GFYU01001314.1~~GFYU01001314.1.p1  ORF type:complete len:440 (+),score=122.74 GFYU01001314.1:123-1442(+)
MTLEDRAQYDDEFEEEENEEDQDDDLDDGDGDAEDSDLEGPPGLVTKGHFAMKPMEADHESIPVTPEYVKEMASYLGFNPGREFSLLWIAKQAAHAELPPNWKEYEDEDGHPYFYNSVKDMSSRKHPLDNFFMTVAEQEKAKYERRMQEYGVDERVIHQPHVWMKFEEANQVYYYNFLTNVRQVEQPPLYKPSKELDLTRLESDMRKKAKSERSDRKSYVSARTAASTVFSKRIDRHPSDYLMFTSWWDEYGKRHYMKIYHEIDTAQFQVILEDDPLTVYSMPALYNTAGTQLIECWDMRIGTRIEVLGRVTTLMQASASTIEWMEKHSQTFLKCKARLIKELRKYDQSPLIPALLNDKGNAKTRGGLDLRGTLNQIDAIKSKLAVYRPSLAAKLVDDYFTIREAPEAPDDLAVKVKEMKIGDSAASTPVPQSDGEVAH